MVRPLSSSQQEDLASKKITSSNKNKNLRSTYVAPKSPATSSSRRALSSSQQEDLARQQEPRQEFEEYGHVRNYESLTMLLRNMNKVYIDEEWVVKRYLELQKSKDWDALKDRNDMLVLQLEREIYAENQGVDPATLEEAARDIETAEKE
jgi:hypothetical protein